MNKLRDAFAISPRIRGLVALLAIVGAFVTPSPLLLIAGLILGILPVVAANGQFNRFIKFILAVILPIALGLLFIWGWLVGAPPGEPHGSAPSQGCTYAANVALRLALVSGVAFACLLNLTADRKVTMFQSWGIRGEMLTLLIVSFTLLPEFAMRTEQIAAARCARGLMPDRRLWTRLRQFPYILRTLFTWAIGNGLARMDLWQQQNLLSLLEQRAITTNRCTTHTRVGNLWFGLLSLAWLAAALYTRFR